MVSKPSMAETTNITASAPFNRPSININAFIMPQAPLAILSNVANLMSIKLDNTNYLLWKHQFTSI